jgi:hypothetical protein
MNDPEICRICNIPVGSTIKFDTGSDLYLKIKCNRTRTFKSDILTKNIGSNNKFNLDDQLFLAHYCRGGKMSKTNKNSIKQFNDWVIFVVNYLKSNYKADVDILLGLCDQTWFR